MRSPRRCALALFVLFALWTGWAQSKSTVQLKGAGSSQSGAIYDVWVQDYRFYRDVVQISYDGSGTNGALRSYEQGTVDFVATERGLSYEDFIQFPLAGQGIVIGYNLPSLSATDPTLILNRTVLGSIWAGSITAWNDTAIQELNPDIAHKLPPDAIRLGYSNDTTKVLTFTEVFKLTLESFSEEFREVFAAANRTFALLPPARNGFAVRVGGSSTSRITWLQKTVNSLTWLNFAGGLTASTTNATASSVNLARMYNKAGRLVELSVASLQSAMTDYQQDYAAGRFGIDIFDAPGAGSWPMAYLTFFAMRQNQTIDDCSNIGELLDFVAWIHTNDEASNAAEENLVAPLDVSLRKQLLVLLNGVRCNGKKAFTSSVLVGTGGQLTLINSWATSWSTNQYKLKFYQTSAATAEQQLIDKNVDFGLPADVGAASWRESVANAAVLPLAAFPLVPAYNMPELAGKSLVLSAEVIAQILANGITVWNDSRIQTLNLGEVAGLLPAQPITVVLENVTSVQTTYTRWLNATVPWWGSAVGVGSGVSFPVTNVLRASDEDDFINLLQANSYSFGIWSLYDVRQARTLGIASLLNRANKAVKPTLESVQSAINDFAADYGVASVPETAVAKRSDTSSGLTYASLLNGGGADTWPLATFASLVYRQQTMVNCDDAKALLDFLGWTQLDTDAIDTANKQGYVLATVADPLKREFLNQIKAATCNGVAVSAFAGCINDGEMCSSVGTCNSGSCTCPSSRTGQYCEQLVSSSSSDSTVIVLATVLPVSGFLVCLGLVVLVVVVLLVARLRRRGDSYDWEIRLDELELGEQLASGGFGQVYRATWKGTEVAVKVMASEQVTREMERQFKEEVRVMTSLRHPNVVLFMAACTKAPKMCIVMEFMSLGSLHDLLHNELVSDIPFQLKAKMAYQASKGMHFLHSSGIVHRDLKSLNLLLDSKWNIKVSDFGLTKFKEEIKTGGGKDVAGSVHWTAPEVLNEAPDADLILADVYSFGIIMWELLTRQEPYLGMSPAAVAVAVIRDGLRPALPDSQEQCPVEFEELITACWHQDPTIRPTFLEIMTRLSTLNGDSSAGGLSMTSKTSTSSSGHTEDDLFGPKRAATGSSGMSSSDGSSSDGGQSGERAAAGAAVIGAAGLRAPEGEVTIVFSDITRAASLWEFDPAAMRDATLLHNDVLRSALRRHRGYEVAFLRDRNSGEGSFCMAFQQPADALAWCGDVQRALLAADWPEALLEHPGAAEEWGDTDDRVLYKGLRVRMGVHFGSARVVRDPMTRRVEYIGPVVNTAARITAMTHGGQIVLSHAVHARLNLDEQPAAAAGNDEAAAAAPAPVDLRERLVAMGHFEMPDAPTGAKLYELKVVGLEGRFFGGVTKDQTSDDNDGDGDEGSTISARSDDEPLSNRRRTKSVAGGDGGGGHQLQTTVGEGMMFKEDTFLTSANLCRWIINYGEIQVGKQIGLGSYGVVYRGKWKGVEVAVKRFIKQKLDERRMLEFRAEMAFLSELHHPNIVLFIGACVKKPNLCIVTEFMRQGSLKDILGTSSVKLTWNQKLRLLRSAALGVNYLHSLQPVIVHRDLKPSNLLVDENWNVKVADFGFARIKEENATMTRCGTPCWTAPEIIRGERNYDERADVFSFGIIMWQVATRKEPFAGRNFMGVSLDVLEGRRPAVPNDCPPEFRKVMQKCWHANAAKRPRLDEVVAFLERQVGDDDHDGAARLAAP